MFATTLDSVSVTDARPNLMRGRWLVGHILIVFIAALMAALGFWQLSRLQERKTHNVAVRSHINAPAVMPTGSNFQSLPDYQHVSINGTWDAHDLYLVRYPIHLGQQGYWRIEPLVLNDGSKVMINRGWISLEAGRALTRLGTDDGGSASVVGFIQPAEVAHRPNGDNGADPSITTKTAITERWVQMTGPVTAGDPVPLDPPDLSNGPHFSYMLQWWSFALIAIIGWAVFIRRAAQDDGVGGT